MIILNNIFLAKGKLEKIEKEYSKFLNDGVQ